MNKVYAVSQGSYSDYGIVAMFSTKEKAKQWCNLIKQHSDPNIDSHSPPFVEEFEVDKIANTSLIPFNVHSKANRLDVEEVHVALFLAYNDSRKVVRRNIYGQLYVSVFARDKEHASKIAADKFHEFIANEKI